MNKLPLTSLPGDKIAIFVVSEGSKDVNLSVFNASGKVIASDIRDNPDPEVTFTSRGGQHLLVVHNVGDQPAQCVLVLLLK